MKKNTDLIVTELREHKQLVDEVISVLSNDIEIACQMVLRTLLSGNKLILVGNGGSAADAQHIAAEFTGRYQRDRIPLSAIALSTDTSALTAIGNDYGFEYIFSRQYEALAKKGDLLIAISSSGNSSNILKVVKQAIQMGNQVLGLSGRGGGEMNGYCNLNVVIPSNTTARIQEMHILIGHILCKSVDENF